jgi:ABC transporter DrrB family efflux protein
VVVPYAPAAERPVLTRGGPRKVLRDAWVVTMRNLRRMMRMPESFVFGLIQPVIFVLLLSYVVGGAIKLPGAGTSGYREFLMSGVFAQTVTFTVAGASIGIADDMSKGMVDRFRTLPMTRSAVLAGRTLSDLLQTAATLLVLVVVALCVGWRIHHGLLDALGAFALLLLLGFALSWIGALIGLSVRTPEAASSGGLIWVFPLTFVSNAFVPVQTMPGWLQQVAYWNPFSATVQACRVLFGTPGADGSHTWSMQHAVATSLLWSLLVLAVFSSLSVRAYRKTVR